MATAPPPELMVNAWFVVVELIVELKATDPPVPLLVSIVTSPPVISAALLIVTSPVSSPDPEGVKVVVVMSPFKKIPPPPVIVTSLISAVEVPIALTVTVPVLVPAFKTTS